MILGSKIKDLRTQKRFTLKRLANQTGLTPSFLSQIESEKALPSIKSLIKIAEVFNTKVGYFFEDEIRKDRRKRIVCPYCHTGMVCMNLKATTGFNWYICPRRKGEGGCGHASIVPVLPQQKLRKGPYRK